MNKQGNTYTLIYIAVLVCIVGAALAWVSLALKPRQEDNVKIDKMQQMLSSIHIASDKTNAIELYKKYIVDSYIIDSKGNRVEGDAFEVSMAAEVKFGDMCRSTKMAIPFMALTSRIKEKRRGLELKSPMRNFPINLKTSNCLKTANSSRLPWRKKGKSQSMEQTMSTESPAAQ